MRRCAHIHNACKARWRTGKHYRVRFAIHVTIHIIINHAYYCCLKQCIIFIKQCFSNSTSFAHKLCKWLCNDNICIYRMTIKIYRIGWFKISSFKNFHTGRRKKIRINISPWDNNFPNSFTLPWNTICIISSIQNFMVR